MRLFSSFPQGLALAGAFLPVISLGLLVAGEKPEAHSDLPGGVVWEQRPVLRFTNLTDQEVKVAWLNPDGTRVPQLTLAPGVSDDVETTLSHRFEIVSADRSVSETVQSMVHFQQHWVGGIPAFYTRREYVEGYPVVASERVNPYALKEAVYLIRMMMSNRPDVLEAMKQSGSRLCVMAFDEYTTDPPEFARMARNPVAGFEEVSAKDYWDSRARGLGGSPTDAVCSCGEENLLGYKGDPYWQECILIHEFAHNIHHRGLANLDPTFDRRLHEAYESAMKAGLWKGAYASVNYSEYFAEGVQNWFNNNRENDNEHNHVNTREELKAYDPGLAALCEEVFGATELEYTRPETRLHGHLEGYDPASAPEFVWPERLRKVKKLLSAQVEKRNEAARKSEPPAEKDKEPSAAEETTNPS